MRAFALGLAIVHWLRYRRGRARTTYGFWGSTISIMRASFTSYAGDGYSGSQSSGYSQYVGNVMVSQTGFDGVARVYWELSGNAIVNGQPTGNPVPTTTELYKIDFFGTAANGRDDWQPIEGDFNGSAPNDGEGVHATPRYPGTVQFGTNHQWIAADRKTAGAWTTTGPGPHTPDSTSQQAGPSGIYMWLTSGSWLYAKWNFRIRHQSSWSALRLTQVTPLAGPPVTGDYNGNGAVDAADYVVWRKQPMSSSARISGRRFP